MSWFSVNKAFDPFPVYNLRGEYQLHPTVFYDWQKQSFESGTAAFIRVTGRQKRKEEQYIEKFVAKLRRENEML